MRVAALYDIHRNLLALEAVLDEVRNASVDRVVVAGDESRPGHSSTVNVTLVIEDQEKLP